MKFNLSVFDIYTKTMIVESSVVDFKGLVAILGNLGGVRDITITDDYSYLQSGKGVSITTRKAGGTSYRFDISACKDEKVEQTHLMNTMREMSEAVDESAPTIKVRAFQLSVTDNKRNCLMVSRLAVNREIVMFALQTFCGMDEGEVRNVLQNTGANPHVPFEWDGRSGPEYPYKVVVIGRDGT